MPLFTLSVDSFQITDTRSVHTDTNYAALTYSVGTDTKREDTAFNDPKYGNYNNGTYAGNLVCAGLSVIPDSPLTFNYLMLNAGFTTPANADSVLANVGRQMTQGAPLPSFASCLQQVAAQYASTFNTILRPGCDGLVAAEQITFQYEDLASRTSGTPATFKTAITHIGPTIAHGCNPRPSHYIVNWSVSQVVAVPDVGGMTGAKAKTTLNAVSLGASETNRNPKDKNVVVEWQSVAAGQLVPLRTTINLTLGDA